MRGIRRDQYGFRVYVKVGPHQREKRYPPDTDPKTMQNWRDEVKVALRKLVPKVTRDTLRADAKRYLAHMKTQLVPSGYASRVCEVNAWLPELGDLPRDQITRERVLDVRQQWLLEGYAPKTCNHRVATLARLYRYVDGTRAETPCDDIAKLAEPDANPQFVTPATIRRVLNNLTDPKDRARFMVLTSSGQRPAQLKRAVRTDVDLRGRVWQRRPAKRGNPTAIYLTDDMVVAWRAFIAAKAWGDFDTSDYDKRLYAAGWPAGVKPYSAKHTLAMTLMDKGADLDDIDDLFGWTTGSKMRKVYTGRRRTRHKRTAALLEGRLGFAKQTG
jgi:integrase